MCRLPVFLLVSLSVSLPAFAADIENGRKLARQCSVCHGKIGVSKDPEVPNLAGQSAFYLEKSLKDYRSGAREDRRMTLIVEPLTDEDIGDLAAWFASIEFTVVAPE
ncbi:cytochrome c [uncultured Roseovarius sp.]|uniref:c-type cytochrome n=1 Tax=uncultured Roseovarius sp. TaxID=293344 RepID=UPI00262F787F|nr:cytochrome c [uncultured Roseovarius sp.]